MYMAKWLCSETGSSALLVSSPLEGSGVLAKNMVELDLPAGLKGTRSQVGHIVRRRDKPVSQQASW
jgi:hypothetical protein